MKQTISILVSGKVQGVFYRQSALEKAQALGISGTVRNLPDGSVAIIATGEENHLKQLLTWCKQGPPRAVVASVESNEELLQDFKNFKVLR